MIKNLQSSEISALGYGTYPLTGQECTNAVRDAIEIGYRHIDTAAIYNNEEAVGRAIKSSGKRSLLFLTTKVWYTDLTPQGIRKSTENSLKKLQLEQLDLLLIHWPTYNLDIKKTLEVFFKIMDEGKTRNIGVSNFPPSLFKEACKTGPVFTNQVEYHPYLSHTKLLEICDQEEVFLTAYSPLAQGNIKNDKLLIEIGEKYQKSPAQVTLRWLIQQPRVLAIPQSSSHERRVQNFEIFDFELTQQEMKGISELQRGKRFCNPEWSPNWEE